MAFQQSDLDQLRQLMAGGIQKVRFADGREVTNMPLRDMLALEQRIIDSLAAGAGTLTRRTPSYSNGF